MAASLLAGCSGGAGSVLTSGTPNNASSTPNNASNNAAVGIQLSIPQSASTAANQGLRRSQYIGSNVNNVAYSFTPGPIAGTIALSTCAQSGTPTVYTCTIGLPANTYNVTITLENGSTAVGSGTATGIAVSPNTTTPVSINITPINSAPLVAIAAGQPTQFYVDGHAQTIGTNVNELDPAGDIITTFYGPVSNYPTLTLSDANGTTGITLNGGVVTFPTVPSAQTGNAATIAYNGAGVNATSLAVKASDGTTTSPTVTIPYISLANNAAGSAIGFSGLGGGNSILLTVTESASTGGTPSVDTQFTNTTTCSSTDVTFSPAVPLTPNSGTNTVAGGVLTYTLTANDTNWVTTPCTVTVSSVKDPNLKTVVTISAPAGAGIITH
jgi:hypothetical protein